MKADLKVVMDEYLPLRDVVFQTLRQAILKGQLEPGERLMEIQLANRLGVSRTPIREAMRKLELEGLVVMVPRKGAEVASITEQDLFDVLEVRRSLECLAAGLACERMNGEILEELKKAMDEFKSLAGSKDLAELTDSDIQFHEQIYHATGNKRLVQLLNNLREQMYRYRLEYLKDETTHQKLVEEHEKIYEALRTGNKKLAEEALTEHIDNQAKAVANAIKEK